MHTLLFVDNNRNIRQFCKRKLEQEGYEVLLAGDGDVALQVLKMNPPDLVVLDVHMPRMNGLDVLKYIRAQYGHLPVIIYTSQRDFLDGEAVHLAEACVEKNGDLAVLLSAISQALGRHKMGRTSC